MSLNKINSPNFDNDISNFDNDISQDSLRQRLNDRFNNCFPAKVKNQECVDRTLDIILRFLVSSDTTLKVNFKNPFQRKIVYAICDDFTFNTKTNAPIRNVFVFYQKEENIIRNGKSSSVICRCTVSNVDDDTDDPYGGTYSDDLECDICEGTGYVRNYRSVSILLRKI